MLASCTGCRNGWDKRDTKEIATAARPRDHVLHVGINGSCEFAKVDGHWHAWDFGVDGSVEFVQNFIGNLYDYPMIREA